MRAPYSAVAEVITLKSSFKNWSESIQKLKRIIRYIPADTSVAECIRADAGTGASIESGSQKWKPSCADLQNAATIMQAENREFALILAKPRVNVLDDKTAPKCAAEFIEEAPNQRDMHAAVIIAASLTLLNDKALKALFSVVDLAVQKLIRRKELAPMSSHPSIRVAQEPAHTSNIIDNLKTLRNIRKFSMFLSKRI